MDLNELGQLVEKHAKTVAVELLPEGQLDNAEIWRLTVEVDENEVRQIAVGIYVKDRDKATEQAWFKNYPAYLKEAVDFRAKLQAEIGKIYDDHPEVVRVEIRGLHDDEKYAYLRVFREEDTDPTQIDRHEYMVFGMKDGSLAVKRLVGDMVLH